MVRGNVMGKRYFSILFITTVYTGGTKEYINRCINEWKDEFVSFIILHIDNQLITCYIYNNGKVIIKHRWFGFRTSFLFFLINPYDVRLIHYHHILNLDKSIYARIMKFKIPYYITLHDYLAICPKINLLINNKYCEEKSLSLCNKCVRETYKKNLCYSSLNIIKWREWWYEFLENANKIIVPHHDMKKRMNKYYENLDFVVINNPEKVYKKNQDNNEKHSLRVGRRIGLIGSMSYIKGSDIFIKCASKQTDITFVLFGELLDNQNYVGLDNIIVTGKYNDNNIVSLIDKFDIDFFWFPSPCPETYCYALTIPMQLGYPIVATDLGAVGARVKVYPRGSVYEYRNDVNNICNIIRTFDYERYWQCKIGKDKKKNFLTFNKYYSIKLYNDVKKFYLDRKYNVKEPIYIKNINKREFLYLIKKRGIRWCVYLLLRFDKTIIKEKIKLLIKKYIRKIVFTKN